MSTTLRRPRRLQQPRDQSAATALQTGTEEVQRDLAGCSALKDRAGVAARAQFATWFALCEQIREALVEGVVRRLREGKAVQFSAAFRKSVRHVVFRRWSEVRLAKLVGKKDAASTAGALAFLANPQEGEAGTAADAPCGLLSADALFITAVQRLRRVGLSVFAVEERHQIRDA